MIRARFPRRALRALAVLALLGAACSPGVHQRNLPRGTLRITTGSGTATLEVEIAAEGRSRNVGLMGRSSMDPDAGMVFLFEAPRSGGFWMKNTLIPLSIAFWDGSGRILRILHMTPCKADPCRVYVPGVAHVGAVETNLGWFAEHGVQRGDRVVLTRD